MRSRRTYNTNSSEFLYLLFFFIIVSFFLKSDIFLLILEFVFGGYRDDDMDACTMSMGSGKPAGIQPGVEFVIRLCRFSPPLKIKIFVVYLVQHACSYKKRK